MKIKIFIIIIIFICLFGFLYYSNELNKTMTNEEIVYFLIKDPNQIISNNKNRLFFNKIINFITKVDPSNPNSIIKEEYPELVVRAMTEPKEDDDQVIGPTLKPLIYIYNTHQTEEYSNSKVELYNITPNVMMASYTLKEKLKEYNIESIVEKTNISKALRTKKLDYDDSYTITRNLFIEKSKANPSLTYFIDVHRDSLKREISYISLNGKNYAKLMFVIGTANPLYQENLKLIENLQKLLEIYYPGITRNTFKRNYIYNQDLSINSLLIEVGGQYNTIDEVYNSMEAFAFVLAKYIGDQDE